ncbi:hypothetical protein I5M03_27990 [Pseudomonas aeruginosa]|nr:hypothetical protein [Pseudomonas aeruginosa]MBH3778907.1 hypothetical protein [Pseudomonas aeruginosa]
MYKHASISDLLGKTIKQITGLEAGSDSVYFECEDGSLFRMYHQQDCCESVSIDDIEGDESDLVGQPLVVAEEVSSEDFPAPPGDYVESYTWTFYRLATAKGFVVIRWLGESNGYYSESVYFCRIN